MDTKITSKDYIPDIATLWIFVAMEVEQLFLFVKLSILASQSDLGCETWVHKKLAAAPTIAICYYYSVQKLLLYCPIEGGSLSRRRHCNKGAHLVPKDAYRSDSRDKHNHLQWDLNLGPGSTHTSVRCFTTRQQQ